MSSNIVNQVAFLRTSRDFPKDSERLTVELQKSYIDSATAINSRVIGLFPTTRPAITGEEWFISGGQKQQTLRQVYMFGAINPGTELDIPTGINSFTTFTRIYGVVVTSTPDWRPIPYVDPSNLNVGIALLVGPIVIAGVPTQCIRIAVGVGSPAIASGQVVLEWLSNV